MDRYRYSPREFGRTKESRSTIVSLEARKGTWTELEAIPRMHSLSASSDLLISADSVRSCRLWLLVSLPRSEPARSTRQSLPWRRPRGERRAIWQMACDRLGWWSGVVVVV